MIMIPGCTYVHMFYACLSNTYACQTHNIVIAIKRKFSSLCKFLISTKILKHSLNIWDLYPKVTICKIIKTSRLECVLENYFAYFLIKTCIMGTQNNFITLLSSTPNTSLTCRVRKWIHIYVTEFAYLELC